MIWDPLVISASFSTLVSATIFGQMINMIEDSDYGRESKIVSVGNQHCSEHAGAAVTVEQPLAVTLGWLLAERQGEVVDIRWQTDTETGTIGFNLLAMSESGLDQSTKR